MLEQAEKLPVSDVLRFGLASAEFAEAVCVAGAKGDELRRVLTFKVDDAAADQMLGCAKRVKHTVHQIRAAYIQLSIISTVLPELCEQKCRSVENARVQALLGMAGDSSVHGLGKVARVDFDRLVRERVIGDKLTIEIPYEISNALFALGKLNGIMMQEIFDFGIERTRERIYKISHITFSFFRIFPRFIFEHFKNIRNVIIHFAPCLCRAFHLFISSSFSSGVVKCTLKFGSGRHKPSCSASSSARANFSAPSLVVMCTLVKMLDIAIVCLRFDLLRILYRIIIILYRGSR